MILLDQTDRRPIYEQIIEKMSELMIRGVLGENTPLPSVRSMASDLSINPNTVQRAYVELERLGYIYSIKGKGSFVADLSSVRRQNYADLLDSFRSDVRKAIHAGIPEPELIDEIHRLYDDSKSKNDFEQTSSIDEIHRLYEDSKPKTDFEQTSSIDEIHRLYEDSKSKADFEHPTFSAQHIPEPEAAAQESTDGQARQPQNSPVIQKTHELHTDSKGGSL